VILADKTQPITGIIHAGREQLMGGLLEQTVAVMEQQGSKRENIAAAIGPCAGVEGPNYVINTNNDCFLSQAKVQDPLITRHFQNTGQDVTGRPLVALNIQSYARQRLEKCGVGDIRCVEIDTITSPICYSRNKKGPPSRLMLSGIKLLRYGS
jgi:copper oxidase (laccase) domain-containing protein